MGSPQKRSLIEDYSLRINRKLCILLKHLLFFTIGFLHPSVWGLSDESRTESQQLESLRIVHREFDQHTERRTQLLQQRERMQATLNETEQEMRSIRDESLQKQMNLMQLQWEEANYEAALQSEAMRITNLTPASEQERDRENRLSRVRQTIVGTNQLLATTNDRWRSIFRNWSLHRG
jgi:septal ring factor EnvC (AmiA/AmiB activator)